MKKSEAKDLQKIPGVGKSVEKDLNLIGIFTISDLKDKNPEKLYEKSNKMRGLVQDRCLLYTFRCAVYCASHKNADFSKLKWWHFKD